MGNTSGGVRTGKLNLDHVPCPHEVLIISSLSFWATEQRARKLKCSH